MENQEKNREYQTEKNYINELKKIGFLKSHMNVLLKYRNIHVTNDSFFLHFIWNQ